MLSSPPNAEAFCADGDDQWLGCRTARHDDVERAFLIGKERTTERGDGREWEQRAALRYRQVVRCKLERLRADVLQGDAQSWLVAVSEERKPQPS